jgi:predicted outer membrane repeat protein
MIAIQGNPGGGTITFDEVVTSVTLTSSLPLVTQTTTITGGTEEDDSVTITAGASGFRFVGVHPFVDFTTKQLSLDHLNITGFNSTSATPADRQGAVVYVANSSGGTITISDSVISSNAGNTIIFANGIGNPTLSITRTLFETNTSSGSGFGQVNFVSSNDLTVTDSTFNENSSVGYGGAIYDVGAHTTTITGSTFSDNSSSSYGGAVYSFQATLVITDDTFSGNSAGLGGAIRADDTLTVTDSTFIDNSASKGGAIWAARTVTVTNSTFIDDTASLGGGAVYGKGTLTFTDDTFSGNSAWKGGAIYADDTLTVTDSTFIDNSAGRSGGAIYGKGTLTVTDSTFSSNSSEGNGGAIDDYGSHVTTIEGSIFSGNSADDTNNNGYGGAVYAFDSTLAIEDSTFSGNSAESGGAIFSNSPNTTTATRSSFYNNSAVLTGAIAASTVNLVNSFVGHNHSTSTYTNQLTTGGVYATGNIALQFSTVYANSVTARYGFPGDFRTMSQMNVRGTLTSTASIIGAAADSGGDGTFFSASAADFSSTVLTGASAYPSPVPIPASSPGSGFQVGPGQVGLETLPPSPSASPGQLGQAPLPTSVAYTAAPTVAPIPSITADQVGAPRPNPTTSAWTIGSRQFAASASPSPSPSPTVTPTPTPAPTQAPSMAPGAQVLSGHVGVPVTATSTFTLANFTLPPRYSVYPALPAGLTLDPATGVVSGTPTAAHPSTRHWITATAGGGAESASSTLQVQVAAGPQPQPVPPLPPGSAGLMVDGQPAAGLTVAPTSGEDGLNLTGPGFTMRLAGLDPDGAPVPLGGDAVLQVIPGANTTTGGGGFAPGSQVGIFLDPATSASSAVADLMRQALGAPRAAEAITLGRLTVAADGTFAGSLPLPDDLAVGAHVLQAVGYSPSGQSRTISVGIRAIEDTTPSILITGSRTDNRVTVNGATEGLTSPTVVPHYRFAGQDRYRTGFAQPTIDASGNFTWSRKAGRTIYLYFTADGTNSNRLILRRDT